MKIEQFCLIISDSNCNYGINLILNLIIGDRCISTIKTQCQSSITSCDFHHINIMIVVNKLNQNDKIYEFKNIFNKLLITKDILFVVGNLQTLYIALDRKQMNKNYGIAFSVGAAIPMLINYIINNINAKKQIQKLKDKRFVGIELGGTNYNVAIAEPILNNKGEIIDFNIVKRKSGITYNDPQQALDQIIQFILANRKSVVQQVYKQDKEDYYFIGVASFGPLCLDRVSPLYGSITTTPKQLWKGVRLLDRVKQSFHGVDTEIDTDVNAAAFAEFKLGNHHAKQSLVYITVGTGVGVGVIAQGKTLHGLTHPEGGHIIVQRSPEQYQGFTGVCPFHKTQTCLEGMVSNKSIAERLNVSFTALADIPDDSKVWQLVAHYLAQLCLNITLLLSPEVIVIGGGIMNRKILYSLIYRDFIRLLSGYVQHPILGKDRIEQFIVAPKLGPDVGVKGAMILSIIQK